MGRDRLWYEQLYVQIFIQHVDANPDRSPNLVLPSASKCDFDGVKMVEGRVEAWVHRSVESLPVRGK